MNEKKKIEVIDNCEGEVKCDVALVQIDESGMQIYVATLQTTEDKQIAEINSKIFIPKDNMLRFTYEVANAFKEYGEKYDEKYKFTNIEEQSNNE